MARELLVYDGLQRCPYLDGKVARMPLYRQLQRLGLDEADARFANQERRVGHALYRTVCPTCSACQGIRVLVDEFQPSRSQRRVRSRWRDVRVEVGPVAFSDEKLELYNRHKFERGLAEPDDLPMDPLGYVAWLVQSCVHTVEMCYWLHDRLVGVGIVDLGRVAASSVYFCFDPDPEIAALSPGVFSVLEEIEFCRRTNRKYLYLGLYVAGCDRLNYKSQYRPHERFVDGDWRKFL